MLIGWYTHHITNSENVAVRGCVLQEKAFDNEFIGGAEMSDWEYRQQAPKDVQIQLVTAYNFDDFDPNSFDRIIVTGTETFSDKQLLQLADFEPIVFVHHLQTPRQSLKMLIDSSSLFITHTPAHMLKELAWTQPRNTAQVLSYFDTSNIRPKPKTKHQGVWAARSHPLKGLLGSQMWAEQRGIALKCFSDSPRQRVLDALASAEWFVHLPLAFESECRTVMEAVLSGCKVHTNNLVGITSVDDWHEPDVLRKMIDSAGSTFWKLVLK